MRLTNGPSPRVARWKEEPWASGTFAFLGGRIASPLAASYWELQLAQIQGFVAPSAGHFGHDDFLA
jgi:hypothetical protein